MSPNIETNGCAAAIELPVMPPPPEIPELAEVLSPSQTNMFLGCNARWWFKYGLQLSDPQGSALAIGKSLHSAMRENFAQKIETKQDLPLAGVLGIYHDEWNKEAKETEFQDAEDPEELREVGASLVSKYLEVAAPHIEPAKVEFPVEGEIGGVMVRGFVDLLDINGQIIDLKSANKTPSTLRPDYRFQIATYHAITPGASGQARLDTLVKLKREIKLVAQPFTVTDADRRSIEVLYPLAQAGMKSGLYGPNRNSYLCSRKNCPFWRACEREFGGVVSGGGEE